jgi:subtilisin family serine protease
MLDRSAQGAFVVGRLRAVATTSQRAILAMLTRRHVAHRAFWVVNAIRVWNAGLTTVREVAARPEVRSIVPAWHARVAIPSIGKAPAAEVAGVEWNIIDIRANKVWKRFGDRGEGAVVGSIDTGVQFDHPALVKSYRGNEGGGQFDHDYDWWDPAKVCPGGIPCDNVAHGTHVMGTMVGKAPNNGIGVAPGARWIAAKGCEGAGCSDTSLISSGQFMLAPTDRQGKHPRPNLRPDVVSNSWGGAGDNGFYQGVVDAWVAAGIVPVFSGGSSGPSCGTIGAPASYVNSYGVGAFDMSHAIASFSSRGPSPFGGETKPNITAPGVNIRSSVPGDAYTIYTGTSMATPHVAGTVALILGANPSLRGNVDRLRAILDDSAVDSSNLQCGGNADDNDVFGEGRLDALAAVRSAMATGG